MRHTALDLSIYTLLVAATYRFSTTR